MVHISSKCYTCSKSNATKENQPKKGLMFSTHTAHEPHLSRCAPLQKQEQRKKDRVHPRSDYVLDAA